eukprot:325445_1
MATNLVNLHKRWLYIASIVFSVIFTAALCIMFMVIVSTIAKFVHKKRNKRYISKRPYHFILWGSFLCEILIFVGMYWWILKASLYYFITVEYCNATQPYVEENETLIVCGNDPICDVNDMRFPFRLRCSHTNSDDDCYCEPLESHSDFLTAWWITAGFLTCFEIGRCFCSCRDYMHANTDYDVAEEIDSEEYLLSWYCFENMCSIHCVFWQYYCMSEAWKRRFVENLFWKRRLWKAPNTKSRCVLFYYGCDMVLRYGANGIFALIMYSNHVIVSDAGKKYDLRQDWPYVIDEILKDIYGDQIGWLIESYVPIFYDEMVCPPELLMSSNEHLSGGSTDMISVQSDHGDIKEPEWTMDDVRRSQRNVDDMQNYLLMIEQKVANLITPQDTEMVTLQSSLGNEDNSHDVEDCKYNETKRKGKQKKRKANPLLDEYQDPA